MPKLYMVRHGKAAAAWGEDPDPGLDGTGHDQAKAVARGLAGMGPLLIVTSPLRRCRETAAPLAALWGIEPRILDAVREVPSPAPDFASRGEWLRGFLSRSWSEVEPSVLAWRQGLIAALCALSEDSVVFTHFVPINVAVGAAQGTERVVNFRPDHCSVTVFQADRHALTLLSLGRDAETQIR
ncbi:MAG: histidine phosphatase family protein [Alphaproteobacteria bacterium]|nr:histidine phosphatase family protein [Alphaproteobacteria bacterium]